MTKPDEELGLDPVLFANRLEKRFEATTRCSFCWQLSPQTKRMVKSINDDSAICDACLNTLAAALPNFYAAKTEDDTGKECIFCDRSSSKVHRMIGLGGTSICRDCIVEADNILREYENTLHEMGMDQQWDEVPDCE